MGSKNPEDYGIYLADVMASVDGTVISFRDTEDDIPPDAEQFKNAKGNSGTASEPHLHIQHQKNNPLNTKIPICAQGLPIIFEGVEDSSIEL